MPLPTEKEQQFQRDAIRQAYPQLFEAVEEQLRYVDQKLRSLQTSHEHLYDFALSAHLARASKTTLGIVLLCENGFGELAIASLRPLGETMVSAYFMSLDPDVRAAQFDEYAKWEAIEVFRLAERMGWREVVASAPSEFHDSDWIRSVEQQFPARVQGWMQVGMDKAIAAIEECWKTDKGKRQLRETADLLHISGDRHSHVGAIDTVRKLSSTDGQLTLRLGPGREWVSTALLLAAWVYGQVFDLWAEHFELPDIESWRRRWDLLLARCRPLGRDVVGKVGRNDPCPCGSRYKFKRCHLDIVGD